MKLTPLEVGALKRAIADGKRIEDCVSLEDVSNLIETTEGAWRERDTLSKLIDDVWAKFGEMSKLIRSVRR